jgi:hypothetical protein
MNFILFLWNIDEIEMRRKNKQKFKKILNVVYFISVSCELDKDFLPAKTV